MPVEIYQYTLDLNLLAEEIVTLQTTQMNFNQIKNDLIQ